MSVQWDSTGKFIVGPAFNGQCWVSPASITSMVCDLADTSGTAAIPASAFSPEINAAVAQMRSQTATVDTGDGNGPQTFTYTTVHAWTGILYFAGDVVQDILDLLANPPA